LNGLHIEWGMLVCAIDVVVSGGLFKYSSVVHFVCVFCKCTVCCPLFFAFVCCAVAAVVQLAVDSACL